MAVGGAKVAEPDTVVESRGKGAGSLLPQEDIAIVGMACVFAGAPSLQAFWQNIVGKVDAVSDAPPDWGPEYICDPASSENNRIPTRRGGFLGDLARFDPKEFGVMPRSVDGGEPDHYLALQLARDALVDAGYGEADKRPARERIEIILGRGTYINRGWTTLAQHGLVIDQTLDLLKQLHPEYSADELEGIRRQLKDSLPPFNAETAAGMVPNIITGRIANRLDFMGPNFIVDAACASSLVAVQLGVRDLLARACDMLLVGGVQASTPPPLFMIFSQLGALSGRGQVRAFDKDADGTLLGEGGGIVVMKRLTDAERDGDRIYALVKGVGTASDGRAVAVLTPRLEGQVLALRRAYEMCQLSPLTIELIEAHGTGTPVGDMTEIQTLRHVFGARQRYYPSIALGSVKSMISHTIPAAGIAGMIKTALALYHGVLPPTLHCDEPDPKFDLEKTPFYVNTETRPWIHGAPDYPRRAGVNAFGFGGINAHVILEEPGGRAADERHTLMHQWDSEVIILKADSRAGLIEQGQRLRSYLEAHSAALKDIAYTLNCPPTAGTEQRQQPNWGSHCLAIVASSVEDLAAKLDGALQRLSDPQRTQIKDRSGIYFTAQPLGTEGRLAFLFPGEGSQYVNMLSDLCVHFPEVRAHFDRIDRVLFHRGMRDNLPSQLIFPPPGSAPALRQGADDGPITRAAVSGHEVDKLWQMEGAVAAVFTANQALASLLERLGLEPQAVLGHSTGEYTALQASGIAELGDEVAYQQFVADLDTIYQRVAAEVGIPRAALVAVGTDSATVSQIIEGGDAEMCVAMDNCPHQTVIAGQEAALEQVIERMRTQGLVYETLPFDRPYHTPQFGVYAENLRPFFNRWLVSPPQIPVYSCTTMAPYPSDLSEIRELALRHWVQPVRFRETIQAMYDDGIRIFVEVGPRGNLTAFVDDILRNRPHLAVASNVPSRSGIAQLNHAVALLAAHGVRMRLEALYERRAPRRLALDETVGGAGSQVDRAKGMKLDLGLPILRLRREADAQATEVSTVPGPEVVGREAAMEGTTGGNGLDASTELASLRLAQNAGELGAVSSQRSSPVSGEASALDAPGSRFPVLERYFRTMERFLDIQQEVMRAYLAGDAAKQAPVPPAPAAQGVADLLAGGPATKLPPPVSAKGPVLPDMPASAPVPGAEVPAEMPTAAGLSSAVDGFGGRPLQTTGERVEQPGDAAAASTAAPSGSVEIVQQTTPILDAGTVGQILLRLVSDKTGYPTEMLDVNLDLEADLGIDSIKRVEILGAFQRETGIRLGERMEQLAARKTLSSVIEFLAGFDGRASVSAGNERREPSPKSEGLSRVTDARRDAAAHAFPFVEELVAPVEGEAVVRCEISLDTCPFLHDHTFGRQVSVTDPGLRALAVMPLTMSMEMMAEVAAILEPGYRLVGMKEVRAYRWIALDDARNTLRLVAHRLSTEREVHVQIRETDMVDSTSEAPGPAAMPIVEGVMVFADAWPEPPLREEALPLHQEVPSKWAPSSLYEETMFHGPAFQGVRSMDRLGADGAEATLEVLPREGLFRADSNQVLLTDPVLLDQPGQVIGFWAAQFLEDRHMIFPFRLEALQLFGPPLPPHERVTCQARISLVGEQQMRSDLDIVRADGRVWARLVGWEDRRFDLSWPFFHYMLRSNDLSIAQPWPMAVSLLQELATKGKSGESQAYLLSVASFPDQFFSAHGGIWRRVLANLVLSRRERLLWRDLQTPEPRRLEWLLGRVAAKDAVRQYLRLRFGLNLCPADVEILPDDNGQPMVHGPWLDAIPGPPLLSVSHAAGTVVAVAIDHAAGIGVGVDIEQMGRMSPEMENLALTAHEQELLSGLRGMDSRWDDEGTLRFWCAKEAVAKALGCGMVGGPQSLEAQEFDVHSGKVLIRLLGDLNRTRPEFAGSYLSVYTAREADLVVAVHICERTSENGQDP